ncbi:MAG: hypothetical protein IKW19_09950 [Akkermansia sp.]|nr:hypothetical protein [Akkermansia sp.]
MPTTLPASPSSLPEKYNPNEAVTAVMLSPKVINTMTAAYRSAADTAAVWEGKAYIPSIERCIKDMGRDAVEAMLKLYLVRLNITTNAARPLTEGVIEAMVPVILNHITNDLDVTINLADLRIIFDRATTGQYGKPYGGFTCQEVCSWFDLYNREKMDAIDQIEHRRKCDELGGGRRSNHRGTEMARMRDAMHQYQLEKMKQDAQPQP